MTDDAIAAAHGHKAIDEPALDRVLETFDTDLDRALNYATFE